MTIESLAQSSFLRGILRHGLDGIDVSLVYMPIEGFQLQSLAIEGRDCLDEFGSSYLSSVVLFRDPLLCSIWIDSIQS